MKKLIFLMIVISFAFFNITNQAKAQGVGDCDDIGTNCGNWVPAGTYIYHMPCCPLCPISIDYDTKICDGLAYFRFNAISYPTIQACNAVQAFLIPNGYLANPINCASLLRDAFTELANDYFLTIRTLYPDLYHCDAVFECKSITPGGCNSWRTAYRGPDATHPNGLERLKCAPCENFGCCLNIRTFCYNENTGQIEMRSETNQIIASQDCSNKVPLYNPFQGYGPEWQIGPPTPCALSCYVP